MALSEHEQRMLDEMERHLYQSEADVVQTSSPVRRTVNYRSLLLGIVVALVGVGVLIGGVAASQPWLGLIGFAVMLGGVLLAFGRSGGGGAGAGLPGDGDSSPRSASQRETLGDRLERRWNERLEGDR